MYRRNVPPAVIRDGNTVAWWDFSDPTTMVLDGSNNCSVVFDKSVDTRFGSTLNSGNLVSGKAYKIISQSTPNYFATGKIAGDVFIASTTTALDASNTVQLVQGNPLLQATLANQPKYYATQIFGSALTTGSLVVGRTYQVLATTTNYFGSGVVVGNLFVASSALALSGSNSVREEVSKGKELMFDGVDDRMRCDFAAIPKPISMYSAIFPRYSTAVQVIMDSNLVTDRTNLLTDANGYFYGGSGIPINSTTRPKPRKQIMSYVASTNFTLKQNGTQIASGANGSTGLTGFKIGSRVDTSAFPTFGGYSEIMLRKLADTTANESLLIQYLKNKHQITY